MSLGSKAQRIFHFDSRAKKQVEHSPKHHNGEVCGLKWSQDGQHLVTGGNDNKVNLYSANNLTMHEKQLHYHSAAVKAIQFWQKKRGVIVTGGGNNDHRL